MNKVILIGRTTKEIDLRRTANGTAVVSFTLAVENRWQKDENGRPTADFINCVAWNKTAEIMESYVKKGMQIAVEGRIQTRNYENKDGNRVYVTEVVCESMKMLESRNAGKTQSYNNLEDYAPAQNEKKEKENNNSEDDGFDILDDDLPF